MKPVQSCDVFSHHHHHDKLEVWPSASTQFAMQGLENAIQQQCTGGHTRGGVWPLKSQNITNPRRTFWHRQSLAPFVQKNRDDFPGLCGSGCRVCVGGIGNAALWQIVRYMRLDISAVFSSRCCLEDSGRSAGICALTAGPPCAFTGGNQVSASL